MFHDDDDATKTFITIRDDRENEGEKDSPLCRDSELGDNDWQKCQKGNQLVTD
jgi:hypothetical protein